MASIAPKTGVLGQRLAAHLLRRASFNYTRPRIDDFATKTVDEALAALTSVPDFSVPEPINPQDGNFFINCGTMPPTCTSEFTGPIGAIRSIIYGWWLNEAAADTSLNHKMQFFLHTCFTTDNRQGTPLYFFDQIGLWRNFALGSYRDFAVRMCVDNAMLLYLNGNTNNAANPNENFAREFLELFTIGKGAQAGPGDYTNYTEADIVEAAKVFSGWKNTNRNEGVYVDTLTNIPVGRPAYFQHDQTDKTFSERLGNATISGAINAEDMVREIEDFVDLVFAQDETARFICRKLYRYFVSRNITEEIENDIIEPLASTLRTNDYNLQTAIEQLLKSEHFYDEDDSDNSDNIVGSLLRSPLDLALQTITYTNIPTPDPYTQYAESANFWAVSVGNTMLTYAGMDIFFPPSVAGYPPMYQAPSFDRGWFNSNTIVGRYKIPEMMLTGQRILRAGGLGTILNPVTLVEEVVDNPTFPYNVVNDLLIYLLPEVPDFDRVEYFVNSIFLQGFPAEDWVYEWENYQITGDDTEVRIPLINLVRAIMSSVEYQLM